VICRRLHTGCTQRAQSDNTPTEPSAVLLDILPKTVTPSDGFEPPTPWSEARCSGRRPVSPPVVFPARLRFSLPGPPRPCRTRPPAVAETAVQTAARAPCPVPAHGRVHADAVRQVTGVFCAQRHAPCRRAARVMVRPPGLAPPRRANRRRARRDPWPRAAHTLGPGRAARYPQRRAANRHAEVGTRRGSGLPLSSHHPGRTPPDGWDMSPIAA